MRKYDERWMHARAWYATGRMVDWKCEKCGASPVQMPDECPAPLEERCPGFNRTEEIYEEFEQTWESYVADETVQ